MVVAATDCHLAGRYRLCRWLAAGGMRQVWQAADEVLCRLVAVKLLHDEDAQDPSFVSRLRADARYAAAVTHPGIASVFDYGEVTTADGLEPTLFGHGAGCRGAAVVVAGSGGTPGAQPEPRDRRAGGGGGCAHRAGLVHRDVKPANLLVGPNGTVKVTDFGVAQAPGRAGRSAGGTGGHGWLPVARGRPARPPNERPSTSPGPVPIRP